MITTELSADDQRVTRAPGSDRALAPFEWRGVLAVAGIVTVLLVALSTRYGWHRDELYFRVAAEHLAWGYVDQPPFTPFVAHLAQIIAPGNLALLRLLPALTTAMTVVLGGLIAREFGASRHAQIAGAGVVAAGGYVLGVGHLLSTSVFDLTAWMALLFLTARLLRTGDTRWWLAIGGVAGVAMLNKNLVVLLGAALLTGLLIERRWELLASRWLLAGGALAVAIAAPHLIWQAQHGWPQFEMARALSRRIGAENRGALIPEHLLAVGPLFVILLWRGARSFARDEGARAFRALIWAWPAGLVLTFATGGRSYYVVALAIVVALAGVVAAEQATGLRRLWSVIAVNGALSVLIALPLLPVSTATVDANDALAETVGWPELAEQVALVVQGLPSGERASVVILAKTYGEAGAIDRFGTRLGLTRAFSPHNSYADFGQPTDDRATVVAVRFSGHELGRYFDSCRQVATIDNDEGVDNEAQGQPILVCRGLRGDWESAWESLRFLS